MTQTALVSLLMGPLLSTEACLIYWSPVKQCCEGIRRQSVVPPRALAREVQQGRRGSDILDLSICAKKFKASPISTVSSTTSLQRNRSRVWVTDGWCDTAAEVGSNLLLAASPTAAGYCRRHFGYLRGWRDPPGLIQHLTTCTAETLGLLFS